MFFNRNSSVYFENIVCNNPLEISQNSQENTCARGPLIIKLLSGAGVFL